MTETKVLALGVETKTAHVGQDQKFTYNIFTKNSKRQIKTNASVKNWCMLPLDPEPKFTKFGE